MKRESWMGALMKRNALVHKSKNKVGGYVGIYRTRVGMRFAYQDMSRIQGSKKTRSKEQDIEDLFYTQEVKIAEVLAHHDVGGGKGTKGRKDGAARKEKKSQGGNNTVGDRLVLADAQNWRLYLQLGFL
ncbi:hypothetical protein L3X38_029575 [Prunus dulcis]|uniref:Uncharacterized protein n=1 Tax=Prunus dulcis TaxID=3755 RepID=A0AAD4VTV2_PRUDU|nr:hypothetical protein L3X38_029575 [Prunus dulcis]